MKKAELKKSINELPSAKQLEQELNSVRYRRNFVKILGNTVASLLVVAAAATLIAMLFLPFLRVTGSSMTPTLYNDEMIVCSKRSNFKSGDVVAFYYNNKILLKRVIGTSGDFINITEDGTVYLNGEILDEPYVEDKALGECDIPLPYQVPDNRIFVMGDHRSVSVDSRSVSVGCIADEYVIGKVIFRIWPPEKIGTVQ
ncbi:MAG: signal peptidase I [Ruminococcus sp.]|nr:signal peptidase I [Ruminococcus sp.]